MAKRQGPYIVIRKITPLTYKLDLYDNDLQIHPVINIQYLTPYKCSDDPFHRIPPPPDPIEYNSDSSGEQK